MYYLTTEYELPMLMYGTKRKVITICNKNIITDMYDHFPHAMPETRIIPKDALLEFMKDGYETKSNAENDNEAKKAVIDYVGLLFRGTFKVMSEEELLQKYESLK